MSHMFRLILATVAVVALVAACSGTATGPGVATLDDPSASDSPGASPAASALSPQDAALAFARCMRENGIDMPDPVVSTDGNGGTKIDQRSGPGANTPASKDKFNKADEACRHFMEAAAPNGQGPAMSAEDQDKVLAFAKCMREHGVDMPDPDFSGGGVRIQVNGGSDSGGMGPKDGAEFQAADAACSSLLPGKMGPGGPGTDSSGTSENPAVNQ